MRVQNEHDVLDLEPLSGFDHAVVIFSRVLELILQLDMRWVNSRGFLVQGIRRTKAFRHVR